jgi:hypothetical protein
MPRQNEFARHIGLCLLRAAPSLGKDVRKAIIKEALIRYYYDLAMWFIIRDCVYLKKMRLIGTRGCPCGRCRPKDSSCHVREVYIERYWKGRYLEEAPHLVTERDRRSAAFQAVGREGRHSPATTPRSWDTPLAHFVRHYAFQLEQ